MQRPQYLITLVWIILTTLWAVDAHASRYGHFPRFGGVGFKGGLAISNMTGNFIDFNNDEVGLPNGPLNSFSGGVFFTYRVSPAYSFQQEILYTCIGTKWESSGNSFAYQFTYVELVTLGKIIIPTGSTVEPTLFFGPHWGLLVAADGVLSIDGERQKQSIMDGCDATELGLDVGIGLEFLLGRSSRFVLEGRYSFGLSNVFKRIGDFELNDKLSGFSCMAGFGFM